jgi:hypothetical protein
MNRSEALALLNSLGDTPEQVADALLAQGIVGICGGIYTCPISRYLRAQGACGAATSKKKISLWDKRGRYGFRPDVVIDTLPKCIVQFISMFDQGKFPNLETK